jgi:hypothetical protein
MLTPGYDVVCRGNNTMPLAGVGDPVVVCPQLFYKTK